MQYWKIAYTRIALVLGVALLLAPVRSAFAGGWEFSLGFSYNRSTYDADSYSWNRRLGGSIGYAFLERSQVEIAYQNSFTRTFIANYENTSFTDQVYSLNWIQSFADKNSMLQPYLKVGVGQLNRDAEGTYASGARPTSRVDAVTGVLGAGFRLYLLRNFAIRTEATSYLEGGKLNTWNDNFAITIGLSLYY